MRIIVLMSVVFIACGTQTALHPNSAAVQVAVSQLGSAFVEQDSTALYEILTPGFRARLRIDGPELKGVLKDIFDQQRDGWMRTLGEDARKPRIHSIHNGYGDEFEVTLEIKGQPSEKKLYFQWVDGDLKFSGVDPNPGPAVAATAVTVSKRFLIENFMSVAHSFSYGGDFSIGVTNCGGDPNTSVPAYTTIGQWQNCTDRGAASCKVTFNSDRAQPGGNWCASWGWFSIDHAHQGGVTGCWYQWIGDDMWFFPMDMHGGSYGYDARCVP